jgi:hypothetical protein
VAVDLQQRMHMRMGMFVDRLVGLEQRDPSECALVHADYAGHRCSPKRL